MTGLVAAPVRSDPTDAASGHADDIDAVVIGSGPNGLVAANVLADAGWRVLVLEAQPAPGGAVRTAEITTPGFANDLFSAFYPLAAASPVLADLHLEDHGLRWAHAPTVLAHPLPGRPAAVLDRDIERTASALHAAHDGDGRAYRMEDARFRRLSGPMIDTLLRPFPPVRSAARLALRARVGGVRELTRLSLLPLRRYVEERFGSEQAAVLYAGMAMHADLTPESAGSALFGWLLTGLGQHHGFPVPVGGAGRLTDALVARLAARGGVVRCSTQVVRVIVREGRVVAVRTADGDEIRVGRAVLADTDASKLLLNLVGPQHLPASTLARVPRIQRGDSTFKVDWALSSPVPWDDESAHGAGTVHLADSLDELTVTASELSRHLVPSDPFVLVGQMTTADATRSPPGTESLWAYAHVPQVVRGDPASDRDARLRHRQLHGVWDDAECDEFAERIEARIEAKAPGFRSRILARHVMSPRTLERMNANLVGGDINGGTAQLHQQLVFRPIAGWARSETPVRGLYLASASAHPGGGVHGACGANAARAAIAHHRWSSGAVRSLVTQRRQRSNSSSPPTGHSFGGPDRSSSPPIPGSRSTSTLDDLAVIERSHGR